MLILLPTQWKSFQNLRPGCWSLPQVSAPALGDRISD